MKSSSVTKHSHVSNHHASNAVDSAPASSTLAARVQRATELIQQALSELALGETALSPEDKRRALKLKKGGEQFVPQLAALSARYGVEVPSRPTEAMTASLQRAQQLEPLRTTIEELSSIVDGAYVSSRSETWKTATSLYGMLKKGSAREPKLGIVLQPLQAYFANRHPSVKAANAKVPAATAVDKAQAKAQKQIAKLQKQLAKLQGALPAPSSDAPPEKTEAPTPTPSPAGEAPQPSGASPANGAAHLTN